MMAARTIIFAEENSLMTLHEQIEEAILCIAAELGDLETARADVDSNADPNAHDRLVAQLDRLCTLRDRLTADTGTSLITFGKRYAEFSAIMGPGYVRE
jgi:hypothetical protein